jgi:hypothetical protein
MLFILYYAKKATLKLSNFMFFQCVKNLSVRLARIRLFSIDD